MKSAVKVNQSIVRRRESEILRVVSRNGWQYLVNCLSPAEPIISGAEPKPSLPRPQVVCQILAELGPTYVKLGQLLSTRPDLLPPEYVEALEQLQSSVPPVPWEQIKPQIEVDLGQPIDTVFAEFPEEPVAAGSLGQVYRAKLQNGETVAVKVQRPGIRQTVEADLETLQATVNRLQSFQVGKDFDLQGLLNEFRNSITSELDFRLEANNTQEIQQNLLKNRFWPRGKIRTAKVYPEFSQPQLLVLDWVEGQLLLKADMTPAQKAQVADLLAQMVMNQFFIDGFFHADPHPGNFMFQPIPEPAASSRGGDFTLVLLDCGMAARLDPRTRNLMVDLFLGIIEARPDTITQALYSIGFPQEPVNLAAMESDVDRLLRQNYAKSLADLNLGPLIQDILDIPRTHKIQLPGSIGLFLKAIANAEGVARGLNPEFSFIEVCGPVIKAAVQRRYLSKTQAQQMSYNGLVALESLSTLPTRLERILTKLEGADLGVQFKWKEQLAFQQTFGKGIRRLSVSILSVGAISAGANLIAAKSAAASNLSGFTLVWGNGLLGGGLALALVLLVELVADSRQ